ncbi:hypothetical protein [Dyadobacter sp. CY326]|uniref:hypothetical protein n=1 Tax=Dyadobacter sp. CY326 TaxID=2907300 RepID=UPI001F34709A|nr:hypothetical protein [Dyadobacter sp. CY326]MCE7063718.1 hypothetical protein [Dyadobacter sp. CY326]
MKSIAKTFLVVVSLLLLAGRCEESEGWKYGIPITSQLTGTWMLEKVVTPRRTVWDKQIGYSEVLEINYKDGYHVEETFKNDTIVDTQYWGFHPGPVAKTKGMTVLVTYRYGLKRFYKMHQTVSQPTILEASAYLPELGGAADTVKFFYKQVW